MPPESKTLEKAEETISMMIEGNRRIFGSLLEFQRSSIQTSMDLLYASHVESMKMADSWMDQMGKFQKTAMKQMQDCTNQMQKTVEQTLEATQKPLEDMMEKGLDMMKPGDYIPPTTSSAKRSK